MKPSGKKCIFLDRDGVINKSIVKEGKPFAPLRFRDFKILPNVKKTIIHFKKKNYLVIVITNQPEINNGKLSLKEFRLMNEKIFNFLNIDDLYFCPHKKTENCKCRKPNVGLFKKAISKHKINIYKSYFIGDRKSDIDITKFINIKTIFIDRNYVEDKPINYDYKCKSIYGARKFIK